ncbi:MAG: hypothetical protein P1V97_35310, partial [Planctomycetota bacterium]|nr:hypothetical protein [Planctomycetota bacterium]
MTADDDPEKRPNPEDVTVALPDIASKLDPSLAETLVFANPDMKAKIEETLGRWGKALGERGAGSDPTVTLKGAVTIREEPSWLQSLQSATILMK